MELLFQKARLYNVLENYLNTIKEDINSAAFTEFQNKDSNAIVEHFSQKYKIEPPALLYDKAFKSEPEEITISSRSYGREYNTPAFLVTVSIPVSGNSELLNFMPSQSTTTYPEGELTDNELNLSFRWPQNSKYELKKEYNERIELLKNYIDWIKEDVNRYIPKIADLIKSIVIKKLEGINNAKSVADEIDLPIR